MNSSLLYQWEAHLSNCFPSLGRWQAWTLALFSYGVLLAKSCRLLSVAQALTGRAEASSLERRLQRWLANERIDVPSLFRPWVGWVVRLWGKRRCWC